MGSSAGHSMIAERFVQEIRTTASLGHPHILPLFDSGEAAGQLYYVMPCIQGETIRDRLTREGELGVDDAEPGRGAGGELLHRPEGEDGPVTRTRAVPERRRGPARAPVVRAWPPPRVTASRAAAGRSGGTSASP